MCSRKLVFLSLFLMVFSSCGRDSSRGKDDTEILKPCSVKDECKECLPENVEWCQKELKKHEEVEKLIEKQKKKGGENG